MTPDYRRLWRDAYRYRRRMMGVPLHRRILIEVMEWCDGRIVVIAAIMVTAASVYAALKVLD